MCCDSRPPSVRLHAGGRYFTCPCCRMVGCHPPADTYLNFIEGRAFCDFCARWMRIEGARPPESEDENRKEVRGEG